MSLQIDYNIEFLHNNNYHYLNNNNSGFSIGILNKTENILIDNIAENYSSLVRNIKVNLNEYLLAINEVVNDDTIGNVIYIYDNNKNTLSGLFFVFYEFSDWRNSIFWWVNDFIINFPLHSCQDVFLYNILHYLKISSFW